MIATTRHRASSQKVNTQQFTSTSCGLTSSPRKALPPQQSTLGAIYNNIVDRSLVVDAPHYLQWHHRPLTYSAYVSMEMEESSPPAPTVG